MTKAVALFLLFSALYAQDVPSYLRRNINPSTLAASANAGATEGQVFYEPLYPIRESESEPIGKLIEYHGKKYWFNGTNLSFITRFGKLDFLFLKHPKIGTQFAARLTFKPR